MYNLNLFKVFLFFFVFSFCFIKSENFKQNEKILKNENEFSNFKYSLKFDRRSLVKQFCIENLNRCISREAALLMAGDDPNGNHYDDDIAVFLALNYCSKVTLIYNDNEKVSFYDAMAKIAYLEANQIADFDSNLAK